MDMKKLEELKEKLMRELEMVSAKQQLSLNDIAMIDTLAHAIKNLCKVIEAMGGGGESQGYSERHYVRGHYSRANDSYNSGAYGSGAYGSGGSYNSNRSYRDELENSYGGSMTKEEKEVIKKMLERM